MSNGSIKPSMGGSSKTSGSAIRKVSGSSSSQVNKAKANSETKEDTQLAALRPGSLTEETKSQKAEKQNSNDKGEIATSEQNDARTFSNTREDGNRNITNGI
jgi:hypothetical protein